MSRAIIDIWNVVPFPCFILDRENRIVLANGLAEQFVQLSEKQMLGQALDRYFGENSTIVSSIEQARRQGASLTQYGVGLASVEREVQQADLHIMFTDPNLENLLIVLQPVGTAQRMNQSMTHRSAARSVSAMSSMLAHEIRNPLAGITGAAQLLAMNAPDEDKELAQMIDMEAKRIGNLVDRFEHFSDLRPVSREPFNIHDCLDRAVLAAKAGFGTKVNFEKEYDPSLPDASGDADQMVQVFQNLLKNAVESLNKTNGKIRIRTSYNSTVKMAVSGGRTENLPLEIKIIDNGKGISEALLPEIFEPFVTSKVNGTGLGLPMVSKVIAAHDGLIECSSSDEGSCFTLRLPIWKKT